MKKLLFVVPALLGLVAAADASCRVVAVRQNVVAVKQVAVIEKVRVAAVVTPFVQVSDLRVVAPVYGYGYAAPAYGDSRVDRLEKAVEKLADKQDRLIEALRAPK